MTPIEEPVKAKKTGFLNSVWSPISMVIIVSLLVGLVIAFHPEPKPIIIYKIIVENNKETTSMTIYNEPSSIPIKYIIDDNTWIVVRKGK